MSEERSDKRESLPAEATHEMLMAAKKLRSFYSLDDYAAIWRVMVNAFTPSHALPKCPCDKPLGVMSGPCGRDDCPLLTSVPSTTPLFLEAIEAGGAITGISVQGETPRTDALSAGYEYAHACSYRDLCRQLERELAACEQMRELDAEARMKLMRDADGYEDRALKAESALSATLHRLPLVNAMDEAMYNAFATGRPDQPLSDAWTKLRAVLGVPTATQQLNNVSDALGMTSEELKDSLRRPDGGKQT